MYPAKFKVRIPLYDYDNKFIKNEVGWGRVYTQVFFFYNKYIITLVYALISKIKFLSFIFVFETVIECIFKVY
jgi:hypothetical protein